MKVVEQTFKVVNTIGNYYQRLINKGFNFNGMTMFYTCMEEINCTEKLLQHRRRRREKNAVGIKKGGRKPLNIVLEKGDQKELIGKNFKHMLKFFHTKY